MSAENKKTTTLAIIGRPNVGKSTLFNVLTESRKAMVKDEPGVTRDLIYKEAELWGKDYTVVDTGGLTEAQDEISPLIREQVRDFLHLADLLVIVVDYRAGLCPEDKEAVRMAKQTGLPCLMVVNKVDRSQDLDLAGSEFYECGMDLVSCSFEHRHGIDQLLEWIHTNVEQATSEIIEGRTLAIVGKPNAGKSSLGNFLIGDNRLLVSTKAGTTVDAIDVPFSRDGKDYILIDTAGLRRSAKRKEGIEILSAFQSEKAIRKSELVLLLIDGLIGPTDQDAKILEKAVTAHKGVIIVVNKTDLGEEEIPAFRSTLRAKLKDEFHFFQDVPINFISAKTGKGIKDLFQKIEEIYEKLHYKISTKELNDFFIKVIRRAPAPVWGTKNVKFYYLTQTGQVPPSFIAFANHPDGVDNAYRRFLTKHIKAQWGLEGIPIRIFVMKSRSH